VGKIEKAKKCMLETIIYEKINEKLLEHKNNLSKQFNKT
jgi:hypothetical protein